MKAIEKSKMKKKKSTISRLKLELRAMTEVPPCRFLQRCHMAFESPTNIFFVLDYIAGGDLFFHLVDRIQKGQEGFFENEARVLLAEIVLGVSQIVSSIDWFVCSPLKRAHKPNELDHAPA